MNKDDKIKIMINKMPKTYIPGLLAYIIETAVEKKCFNDRAALKNFINNVLKEKMIISKFDIPSLIIDLVSENLDIVKLPPLEGEILQFGVRVDTCKQTHVIKEIRKLIDEYKYNI